MSRARTCLREAALSIPLRGVSSGEVVRLLCGGEADYERSQPADSLCAFLSHSWRGNPWLKSLAVVVFAYFPLAVAAAIATQLVLACGMHMAPAIFPQPVCTREVTASLSVHSRCRAPGHMFAGMLSFWLVLLGHRLLPARLGKRFFFDKGCFQQGSPEALAECVSSIGGVLRRSRRFVVLWSEDYFDRLWCIYEVACLRRFGCLGGSMRPLLIPTILPAFVLFGCCYNTLAWLGVDSLAASGVMEWAESMFGEWTTCVLAATSVGAPLLPVLTYTIRTIIEQRSALFSSMSAFTTEAAQVAVQSDRDAIEECICHWYGDLETFDKIVQGPLLDDLRQLVGSRVVVPFWVTVAFAFPALLRTLDIAVAGSWRDVPWPLGYVLIVNPASLLLMTLAAQTQLVPKPWPMLTAGFSMFAMWGLWASFVFAVPTWLAYVVLWGLSPLVIYVYSPHASELHCLGFHLSDKSTSPTRSLDTSTGSTSADEITPFLVPARNPTNWGGRTATRSLIKM